VLFLTQKALRMMKDGGGVVFITAAADRYNVPNYGVYASYKGATEVFSRYVAKEYGSRDIRSNTVAPSGVVTDFNNGAIRNNPKLQEMVIAQTAMGRLAEPMTSVASLPSCAVTTLVGSLVSGSRQPVAPMFKGWA